MRVLLPLALLATSILQLSTTNAFPHALSLPTQYSSLSLDKRAPGLPGATGSKPGSTSREPAGEPSGGKPPPGARKPPSSSGGKKSPGTNKSPTRPKSPLTAAQKQKQKQLLEVLEGLDRIPEAEQNEEPEDTGADAKPWRRLTEGEREKILPDGKKKGDKMFEDQARLHRYGRSRLSDEQKAQNAEEFKQNYVTDNIKPQLIDPAAYESAGIQIEDGAQLMHFSIRPRMRNEGGSGNGRAMVSMGFNPKLSLVERSSVWRTGIFENLRVTDVVEAAVAKLTPKSFGGRIFNSIRTWRAINVINDQTINTFIAAVKDDTDMIDYDSVRVQDTKTHTVISGKAVSKTGDTHFTALTQTPNLRMLPNIDMDYGTGTSRPVANEHVFEFRVLVPKDKKKLATEVKIESIVSKFGLSDERGGE